MVESEGDSFVVVGSWQGATIVKAIGGSAASLETKGSDFRELEHQGFVRPTRGKSYELTNDGRAAYERLTSPPPRSAQ
jgi:hypothetical protein